MNDTNNEHITRTAHIQAETRRSRWPGWIWAIPIAAAGIVIWLGVRAFSTRGIDVTVVFDTAAGMEAGSTNVTYRGLKVGTVSSLALAKDGEHVNATIDMHKEMEPYLRDGTRFWLVGAEPTLSNLASLKSIVAGPTIAMDPGNGSSSRHFTGLSKPPAITEEEPGRQFELTANELGSVKQGSSVYYLGLEVGKVTGYHFTGPGNFRFDIFVKAPYDKLVRSGSRFWDASAVQISMGGGGVEARLVSLDALIDGAVAFETSPEAEATPVAAAGTRFQLHQSKSGADDAPLSGGVPYRVSFDGAVGDLKIGAPVKLRGFTVGTVTSVGLGFDPKTATLATPVTIALEPLRFHFTDMAPSPAGASSETMNDALRRLVAQGLRAELTHSVPVVGGEIVSLTLVKTAEPATLTEADGMLEIPAAESSGIGALTDKLGNVPISAIGQNVRNLTDHLRAIVASPKIMDSIDRLDQTLGRIDKASTDLPPMMRRLHQTAAQLEETASTANQAMGGGMASQNGNLQSTLKELTGAARSVRSLADYLDRHPEALIKGK
jgi:paraquat-inducible protein B